MRLRTLPLSVRRKLIENQPDILTPLAVARATKYSTPCPRCGGAMHQHLAPRAFTAESVLPRTVARCVDCSYEVDTQSGIVTNTGNPAKVEEALPIIGQQKS